MKPTKLPPAPVEDFDESVRRADESPDFVFSTENYTTGKTYLLAAPEHEAAATDPVRLAGKLSHDAPVLFVNSHIRSPLMRRHLKNIEKEKGKHAIKTMRISNGSLANRYDELRELIEEIGAKALVINLFEKAALTSRHREQLNVIFSMLQEDLDIAIFVYSRENIQRLLLVKRNHRGAIGALAYDAEEPIAVGDQTVNDEIKQMPPYVEWMMENIKQQEQNPPPKPDINKIPCEEYTDYSGGETIHPDDIERDWAKGETMNDELGTMNVGREGETMNDELGTMNVGREGETMNDELRTMNMGEGRGNDER
jgi:hypothetical protein